MRLDLGSLDLVPPTVARPGYDVARIGSGIVHLGVGAFHRAHQAVFTDDAMARDGGDWGIIGVSMRKADVATELARQDGLYTVEILDEQPRYRIVGAIRAAITLPQSPKAVIDAIADSRIQLVTLTITEKGYCLSDDGVDFGHPDIAHDFLHPDSPRSAIGVLAAGLRERQRSGGAPLTILSCDNLGANGSRLGDAVRAFAERACPILVPWIAREAAFPNTMVDCIVPASDTVSRARTDAAIGLRDLSSVQREPFAHWVIEDWFRTARPGWGEGVEFVDDLEQARRLKLHVLNAAHSALAYLGLRRGHVLVREAIRDPAVALAVEAMILGEVAPALPHLPVGAYWSVTKTRFLNPMVAHRLDQIAQDGDTKLAERLYPLMLHNIERGAPPRRMAAVVRTWLEWRQPGRPLSESIADASLLPPTVRNNPAFIAAIGEAALS